MDNLTGLVLFSCGLIIGAAITYFLLQRKKSDDDNDKSLSDVKEIVKDPETADKLSPKYHIGGKRLCVDTGYFETFNRENVHLIDLHSSPITKIGKSSIEADLEYDIDTLILATGFDAMTGALNRLHIVARNGIILRHQ